AGKRGQRFAKPSNREQFPSGERVERIDQYDVAVAPEPAMLKPIVEDEDVGVSEILQPLAGVETIRGDAGVGITFPHENLRFVARLVNRYLSSGGNQYRARRCLSSIAASEDRRPQTGCGQTFDDVQGDGRFTCAAHPDAADADHRRRERPRYRKIAPLFPVI